MRLIGDTCPVCLKKNTPEHKENAPAQKRRNNVNVFSSVRVRPEGVVTLPLIRGTCAPKNGCEVFVYDAVMPVADDEVDPPVAVISKINGRCH